jgi:hypothetical protein
MQPIGSSSGQGERCSSPATFPAPSLEGEPRRDKHLAPLPSSPRGKTARNLGSERPGEREGVFPPWGLRSLLLALVGSLSRHEGRGSGEGTSAVWLTGGENRASHTGSEGLVEGERSKGTGAIRGRLPPVRRTTTLRLSLLPLAVASSSVSGLGSASLATPGFVGLRDAGPVV